MSYPGICRYFLMLSALFLIGCGDKIEPGTTPKAPAGTFKTTVAEAKVVLHPLFYEAVGTVKAQTVSTISGKLMGTVKSVAVREGDRVVKGQVLVVIDDRQVSAQLRQTTAALEEARRGEVAAVSARDAAQAGAELAKATYDRYFQLIADHSASRQEFEEVEARFRQAKATLSQAEAMLAAARERIQQSRAAVKAARVSKKDAEIMAPYNGTVTAKMVDVGDLAAPGTPFLTLEKSGQYQVDVIIPENHIQAVRPEQRLNVSIPVLQQNPLEGIVDTIVPRADPQSRSFTVKVLLPVHTVIHSGMFARIKIPLGEDRLLLVPSTAVVIQGQLTGIFLVDDKKTARFRLIRTGRKIGDLIEVISGLRKGSRFVVSPPPALKDGDRVEGVS